MNSPWSNFAYSELRCKCGCSSDGREMDTAFMSLLQALRHRYGKPLAISSAFRCRQHPMEARKANTGAHSLGVAVDISCQGADALQILRLALDMPFTGVGVQQKGSGRFVHLDLASDQQLPRPALWSY